MGEHESWVIDGNYSRLYLDERLDAADAIVLLRFNRWACLWRVMRRFVKFHGASRPSMSDGCIEHLDVAFVWWVLHQGRDAEHRLWYRDIDRRYQEKTVSIRNQRQLTHYTAHITNLQEHTI
jgi:adenylate kinase family enzyme